MLFAKTAIIPRRTVKMFPSIHMMNKAALNVNKSISVVTRFAFDMIAIKYDSYSCFKSNKILWKQVAINRLLQYTK